MRNFLERIEGSGSVPKSHGFRTLVMAQNYVPVPVCLGLLKKVPIHFFFEKKNFSVVFLIFGKNVDFCD
jgi:hypothetical protein